MPSGQEERRTDEKTGGAKGVKLARFDLIPWSIIREVAIHFGRGARKYDERNWERGYKWSYSFGALHRHLDAFWSRDEIDHDESLYEGNEPHTTRHIIAVVWHALVLAFFSKYGRGTDDRPTEEEPSELVWAERVRTGQEPNHTPEQPSERELVAAPTLTNRIYQREWPDERVKDSVEFVKFDGALTPRNDEDRFGGQG